MINFTFKGHKISIRNDDWRRLKERFNAENANCCSHLYCEIKIKCPLCERFKAGCNLCPLGMKNIDMYCGDFMDSFFKFREQIFDTLPTCVYWEKENDRQARRQLKAILRRMEKIEAEQEK